MSGAIELSISGLSLRIEQFLGDIVPRSETDTGSPISYSASGSVNLSGPQYERQQIWTIEAPLDAEDTQILDLIYYQSDRERRALRDPSILVSDTTFPYPDSPPQSRANIGSVTTIGSFISYFALYRAVFLARPVYRRVRYIGFTASFVLQETTRVPN